MFVTTVPSDAHIVVYVRVWHQEGLRQDWCIFQFTSDRFLVSSYFLFYPVENSEKNNKNNVSKKFSVLRGPAGRRPVLSS